MVLGDNDPDPEYRKEVVQMSAADFISVITSVEGNDVDYELLLLLIIANYFRRATKYKEENWKQLSDEYYDKALKMIDVMDAYKLDINKVRG